jgi:hypothetical protein
MQQLREESLQFKRIHWLPDDTLRWINQRGAVSRVFASNQFHFVRIQLISFVWSVFELRPCPFDPMRSLASITTLQSLSSPAWAMSWTKLPTSVTVRRREIENNSIEVSRRRVKFAWVNRHVVPISRPMKLLVAPGVHKYHNFKTMVDKHVQAIGM